MSDKPVFSTNDVLAVLSEATCGLSTRDVAIRVERHAAARNGDYREVPTAAVVPHLEALVAKGLVCAARGEDNSFGAFPRHRGHWYWATVDVVGRMIEQARKMAETAALAQTALAQLGPTLEAFGIAGSVRGTNLVLAVPGDRAAELVALLRGDTEEVTRAC